MTTIIKTIVKTVSISVLWCPCALLGSLIGVMAHGFWDGLNIFYEIDKWFDEIVK